MALHPGSKLGVYEVTAKIGAGGMGEVYRAHDTTLDRDVAIKVLPDAFATDPERLARFEREAKVLASLNHPNIAAIYGLERSADTRALILELVEGPTLQDRIAKGPIPLDEALPIARQIAEALEAAHEQGIIHRDLKPANVKVKDDGTVKVLDFGLAKALGPDLSDLDAANSPTMTMTAAATKMGVIMGTAAYMSPEQARGKTVDKRADIWAFGVVLFEMLTGRQAFGGTDISETLAAVLKTDLDLGALPGGTSRTIRRLLGRCLQKDRAKRARDIGDVRLELEEAADAPADDTGQEGMGAPAPPVLWHRPVPAAIVALVLMALGGVGAWTALGPRAIPEARIGWFIVSDPNTGPWATATQQDLAISPDGAQVVYLTGPNTAESVLTVRSLDQPTGEPLEATRGQAAFNPFISPDGNWVGYYNAGPRTLHRVSLLGGPSSKIVDVGNSSILIGATWGDDDTIFFAADGQSGLQSVPAGGGTAVPFTRLDTDSGEVSHVWPEALPDNRGVLFTVQTGDLAEAQIAVADGTGAHRILLPGHAPRYALTGHLVYAAGGSLMGVGFDLDLLQVVGDPVPLMDGVMMKATGGVNFDVADDGSLAYFSGGSPEFDSQLLVWVDRQGAEELVDIEPRPYQEFDLSPDGTRLAVRVGQRNANQGADSDIWILDLARQLATRLTFEAGPETNPRWTPDGARIAFGSRDGIPPTWKASDGTGVLESLTESPGEPGAFTPDGRTLVVESGGVLNRTTDLTLLALDGDPMQTPLLEGGLPEDQVALSPDGRWVAYISRDEQGAGEVFVRPFPDVDGGRWQVSNGGGVWPIWHPSGKEIFYIGFPLASGPSLMSVAYDDEPTFQPETPVALFSADPYQPIVSRRQLDVAPDGQRFLLTKQVGSVATANVGTQLHVVLNWFTELQARVPTGR